ncbi:hypothetical protein RZN25_12450 [Bacillaceae bacterium S4-13-56]
MVDGGSAKRAIMISYLVRKALVSAKKFLEACLHAITFAKKLRRLPDEAF